MGKERREKQKRRFFAESRARSGELRASEASERAEAAAKSSEFYRERQQLGGLRANRFMLVRYLSALVFFLNLYWSLLLLACQSWGIVFTLIGFLTGLVSLVECMMGVTRNREHMRVSEKLYPFSAACYGVAVVLTLVMGTDVICPFFASPVYGIVLCCACIAVELIVAWRIRKIRDHTDKRYIPYERAMNASTETS